MTNWSNTFRQGLLLLPALILAAYSGSAQVNPPSVMYKQNPYISNPAMAGINPGVEINLGYQKQWSSIPGTPNTQTLTVAYNPGNNVGLGINMTNDKAGLQRLTHVVGTFAYHLPLSEENQKLNFGISMGFMDEQIEASGIDGDQDDLSVGTFNQRETYFDGDFGISYTSDRLTLQGAVPNLKQFFRKDNSTIYTEYSTFMAGACYKLISTGEQNGFIIEPLLFFRGIKGYKNIFDAGTNVCFSIKTTNILALAIYHSSQNITIGTGVNFNSKISLMGAYTTNTSALQRYTNGNFEIDLKVSFFK